MTRLWILGAADPEMEAIEALLRECGETVAYAADDSGCRVTPHNMYRATRVDAPDDVDLAVCECYLVECGGDYLDVWCATIAGRIDHHRPGDPGYGRPPADFLAASSLGQVIVELGTLQTLTWRALTSVPGAYPSGSLIRRDWEGAGRAWLVSTGDAWRVIPEHLVLTAASDHCLGAAYRGECPGVDPDALMRFRAERRAAFHGRPVEDILADITATQAALRAAPVWSLPPEDLPHDYEHDWSRSVCGSCAVDWAQLGLRDMRQPVGCAQCGGTGGATGCGGLSGYDGACHAGPYPRPWPELPEAATRLGVGYVSGPLVGPDGRRKYTCSGTAEQVAVWMRWATERLEDVYGDPVRGFAGGYEALDAESK